MIYRKGHYDDEIFIMAMPMLTAVIEYAKRNKERKPADDEHRIYPSAHGAHLIEDDRHPIIHHSPSEMQVIRREYYNVPRTSIDHEDGA